MLQNKEPKISSDLKFKELTKILQRQITFFEIHIRIIEFNA